MKTIFIVGIIIFILISVVVFLGFYNVTSGDKYIEFWKVFDEHGSVNGSWGTEIVVEYKDGTSENLNKPLPVMEVYFKNKEVSSFSYVLSFRGTSDEYTSIDIGISNFSVPARIQNRDETWGTSTSGNTIHADVDGKWHEIYRVTVYADELTILDTGYTYNLTFTPTGSVMYRGSSSDSWNNIPLPDWFFLKFIVENGESGKEIHVEFGSEYNTQ